MTRLIKKGFFLIALTCLCACAQGQQEVYSLVFKPISGHTVSELEMEIQALASRLPDHQVSLYSAKEIRVKCLDLAALASELEELNVRGVILGLTASKILGKTEGEDLKLFKEAWHFEAQKGYYMAHFYEKYSERLLVTPIPQPE